MAIPILIFAALLAAVTVVLIFADLSKSARNALIIVDLLIWAFFVIDYVVRFTLATPKKEFVREEWPDLVLVVVPLLQPARLLGSILRLLRLTAAVDRSRQGAGRFLVRHKLYLALGWALGLVLMAAVITPIVEPDNSKFKSFGDGIWWAVVTTTTVGYGDLVPESTSGRIIGLVLMLAGIGIIGIITANIAAMFLEPPDSEASTGDEAPTPANVDTAVATQARLDEIDRKLSEILVRLDEQ